jgi:Flp pilus assembly protein TadG
MRCSGWQLLRNEDGAVAPTIALSLIALIAAGGIAFDYARLATMHTELQDAADQAALAAATQLDGQANACSRAAAAAADLLTNKTYFASYGSGRNVTVQNEATCDASGSIKFYQSYNQTTDTPGTAATSDADAKVVIVTVDARQAKYALTPIVGVLSSGNIAATAVASLGGSAICKVPPLMICNPNETAGAGGVKTFDPDTYKGRGLKLEAGGGGSWGPGNYGYLDFGNGANAVEKALAANVDNDPCVDASSVSTKTGNQTSVTDGINTRFDIYGSGLVGDCTQTNNFCNPAVDVIKDVIHKEFTAGTAPNETAKIGNGVGNSDNCGTSGNGSWSLPLVPYLPDSTTRAQVGADPTSMGSPRDICHAISSDGDCGGTASRFGNGAWDRNLYFKVNYGTSGTGWQSLAWLTSWGAANGVAIDGNISRYNVYRAEVSAIQNGTLRRADGTTDAKKRNAEVQGSGGNAADYYSYANARCASPQAATATVKDRRVLTAAIVNCQADGLGGNSTVHPIGWMDIFLVEPSLGRSRTSASQIYVEIIGGATRPDGSNAFQYYLKQRPRLIK